MKQSSWDTRSLNVEFMQEQRQVCMFLSESQVSKISNALKVLGLQGQPSLDRRATVAAISAFSLLRRAAGARSQYHQLRFSIPVFPTSSPYITSVGGTRWQDSSHLTQSDLGHGQALEEGSAGSFQCPNINRRASRHLTSMSSQPDFPPHGSLMKLAGRIRRRNCWSRGHVSKFADNGRNIFVAH